MEQLTAFIWHGDRLFGVELSAWKIVGWLGNAVFFSRFFVQWYATEKKKQVVVPVLFWYLSLTGSLLLLIYSLHLGDKVIIFAYAFPWIPYIRNLVIHFRHKEAHINCPTCGLSCPPQSKFCSECGTRLIAAKDNATPQK
jgi:lipid-A-disaccharide synthase-like uncharacterized protein